MIDRIRGLACVMLLALAGSAHADIINPARLELKESSPAVFDVTFTLPVISGKRVKAKPVLPAVCRDLGSHRITGSAASYEERWSVSCDAGALHGETIEIVGLLGTPVEVMLQVSTLDGRAYSAILKPARSVYVVPDIPSSSDLLGRGILAGARQVILFPEWWILFAVAAFFSICKPSLGWGLAAYAVGHATGQALLGRNWLLVADWIPPVLMLLIAALPALDLARGYSSPRIRWFRPWWLTMLALGLLLGGSLREPLPVDGLSLGERSTTWIAFTAGTVLGLIVIVAIAAELRRVLLLVAGSRLEGRVARAAGCIGGCAAWGLLFYQGFSLLLAPAAVPYLPYTLMLIAALTGIWLRPLVRPAWPWLLLSFLLLLVLGLGLAHSGARLPLSSFLVLGSLFALGLSIAAGTSSLTKLALPLSAVTIVLHGFDCGRTILSELTLPNAHTVGSGLLAGTLFYLCLRGYPCRESCRVGSVARVFAGGAVLLAVAWRIVEYQAWFDGQVATERALGFLRLPLLSFVLLIVAIIAWRRGKKPGAPGTARRSGARALVMLCLAFFALPHGTVRLKNPWFELQAPRGQEAKRILRQILSNTYFAFNVEDEDDLYDQLSQSVSGDLVEDIYLDSRRRLTAGTRQGAQITVKDVSVLSVGDAPDGTVGREEFSYDCKWIVTARVQHMQHVHHRQNIYNGILTIRAQEDRWNLVDIILMSEERIVIQRRT